MQWAIQLLLWSALWEQNEISIVIVIWQDSTSSRGGFSYLPGAKNSAQENAQYVCMDLLRLFFAKWHLTVSFLTSLHWSVWGSFSRYSFQAMADVLHCPWKLSYHKHDSFPIPFCNSWLHICCGKENRKIRCALYCSCVCSLWERHWYQSTS